MDRHEAARALRVRFAPSPAASLHVGSARTALFNWLLARRAGGAFVLRIDDLDAAGTGAGSAGIVRDLQWLGLTWDEGPDAGGAFGPARRSERAAVYFDHAERLLASGAAYERDGALWFRIPPGVTVVRDAIKGDVAFDHAAIDDFVIRRSNGVATRRLAGAVDDAMME